MGCDDGAEDAEGMEEILGLEDGTVLGSLDGADEGVKLELGSLDGTTEGLILVLGLLDG